MHNINFFLKKMIGGTMGLLSLWATCDSAPRFEAVGIPHAVGAI